MKLDMQHIYIVSRFRTAGSNSGSGFNIELPRSFIVPDGVVAHIDDIVIPVSWSTVDERNNTCYVAFKWGEATLEYHFTFDFRNYDGLPLQRLWTRNLLKHVPVSLSNLRLVRMTKEKTDSP
jgi:hypothetical protein